MFWFAHAAMLYFLNAPFRGYMLKIVGQTAGMTAVLTAAAAIGVWISAYAVSALLPAIQSLMEGNWSQWLVWIFVPAEMRRYDRLDQEIVENRRLRGTLANANEAATQVQAWQKALLEARKAGNKINANNYTRTQKSAVEVRKLARRRHRGSTIGGDELNHAVATLVIDLRRNNADMLGPDRDNALENTRQLLWDLIEYAEDHARARYRALVTRRQFGFGALPLAPTRMGNVARSVQSYCVERYEFNFELFWSRLQLPAQRDKDFGPVLQDAKTQLDFLISCSALTLFWAIPWSVWLYVSSGPPLVFLAVSVLGPLVAYAWYKVAVAQYRTLADLLRASVDLFRFDLLTLLHFSPPTGVQQERELWRTIDALHALYEHYDLSYTAPKP